jgi:hypothetical protein
MSSATRGQAIAFYSRENEAEVMQAKMLTADEPRRIAINIARLPECSGGLSATKPVAGDSSRPMDLANAGGGGF